MKLLCFLSASTRKTAQLLNTHVCHSYLIVEFHSKLWNFYTFLFLHFEKKTDSFREHVGNWKFKIYFFTFFTERTLNALNELPIASE